MKKMRKAMNAINQEGAMIIPFLLTITPQNHALCLESKITQEFSQKNEKVRSTSILHVNTSNYLQDLPVNIKGYVCEQIRKYQAI